ncbi:MAG: transcription/translation regulatory transformer protein RfaH [Betaproteobacteria bacterium]|nr:transcription/translation regulatory transformer protein RfaH [Betaproteobacteria bacterium]
MIPTGHKIQENMHWYLIHTKPRLEKHALENLERQGYECYLPLYPTEKLRQRKLTLVNSPLFPRYLFIHLGQEDSLSPLRSTRGVSQLVRFGQHPAKVDGELIALLKSREQSSQSEPQRMFGRGDPVRITDGPFADIEAVYQMPDGECRALVLIEVLNKPVSLRIDLANLRKTG